MSRKKQGISIKNLLSLKHLRSARSIGASRPLFNVESEKPSTATVIGHVKYSEEELSTSSPGIERIRNKKKVMVLDPGDKVTE